LGNQTETGHEFERGYPQVSCDRGEARQDTLDIGPDHHRICEVSVSMKILPLANEELMVD
jgi:hypothetical protein